MCLHRHHEAWAIQLWLSQLMFATIWSHAILLLFNENIIFHKAKSFICSIMYEQPIELPLVKIELWVRCYCTA